MARTWGVIILFSLLLCMFEIFQIRKFCFNLTKNKATTTKRKTASINKLFLRNQCLQLKLVNTRPVGHFNQKHIRYFKITLNISRSYFFMKYSLKSSIFSCFGIITLPPGRTAQGVFFLFPLYF